MNEYITLPNGSFLFEGSVIQIKRLPQIEWIVQYGQYKCDNQIKEGWNLLSVSGRLVSPLYESDLNDLIVVSFNKKINKRYIPLQTISIEESSESEVHDV